MEKIRKQRRTVILAVISLVCCLVIIGGLNKPHVSPFTTKTNAKYPVCAARSDEGFAILDNQEKRMLILSPDLKLTHIVDTAMAGSPIDRFSSLTMYGDKIYAIGSSRYNKGVYISSESVIEYDMRGNVLRTVYSKSYPEAALINNPRFSQIMVCDDRIYLVCKKDCGVTLLSLEGEAAEKGRWTLPEPVYSAGYLPLSNTCTAIGLSKTWYEIDCAVGTVKELGFNDIVKEMADEFDIDASQIDFDGLIGSCWVPSTVVNKDGTAQYFSIANPSGNIITVFTNDTCLHYPISQVPYSAGFLLKNICFWLSLVFVSLEAAAALLWFLAKKLNRRGKTAFALIGAVILTSIFYTVQMQKVSDTAYSDALVSQTKQMSYILSNDYGDIFEAIRDEGIVSYCADPANQEDIAQLQKMLKKLCDANGTENSRLASCFFRDADGQLYMLSDSTGSSLAGEAVFLSDEVKGSLMTGTHKAIVSDSFDETFVYDYDYIYSSDGDTVGVLSLSGLSGSLRFMQAKVAVEMSVTLLALIVGIYVTISVLSSFSADLRRRKTRAPSDTFDRSMDLMQIYSFTGNILYGLDSVIVVYVARSLSTGVGGIPQAVLAALPVAALSLGQVLGRPIAVILSRRISERAAAVFASAMIIVSMLICFISVRMNSIYIYTGGKFALGLFVPGMMYVLTDGLPYHSKDEGSRKTAINSIIEGGLAATILSALAGGYISQYFSYSAIYLLGAVIAVLFLVLSASIFAKTDKNKNAAARVKMRGTWSVFLKGPMLVYLLLYVLPGIMIDGYSTYLFPMFSSGVGISALQLSKLLVFVRAFTYIMNGSVKRFAEKCDGDAIMVTPLLVICFGFICFFISPNIYWAIVMLFVYEVMSLMTLTSSRLYLVRRIESFDLDVKRVLPHYYTVDSVMHVFQSPILSAVVPLGMNLACTVVGAACGVMYTVFALFMKHDKKKTDTDPQ